MLDRFLIIGAGGSGGRTVRMLQTALRQRLDSQGWTGPIPAAWSFLHVDVPTTADVDDAGPAGRVRYIGLAGATSTYAQLDQAVGSRGQEAFREYSRWRPAPDRIGVNPVHGAGQYRAVGRVVQVAAMPRLVQALTAAVAETAGAAISDLAAVSARFGDTAVAPPGLKIIVVSSLAGGAGSGIFLDICDALRLLQGNGQDETTALLYAPDIFHELSGPLTEFLMFNALASMSELVAATWDNETPDPTGEFALLDDAGIAVPAAPIHRGPRRSFLLSSTNGEVTLPTQRDAYRLVASTVASWMTQSTIQQAMDNVLLAGWPMVGAHYVDNVGVTLGETQPFSSLGFGRLGLGRDRFAEYARRRLTGSIAQHLLFAHRTGDETSDPTALAQLANAYRPQFLSQAGLAELGPTDNQILDALRGGTHKTKARATAGSEFNALVAAVTGDRSEIRRDDATAMLTSTAAERVTAFHQEVRTERERNAAAWVTAIQAQTLAAVATSLRYNGGPGTVAVLNSAAEHLRNEVVPELRRDATEFAKRASASATQQGITGMLAGLATRIAASDSRLAATMQQVVNRWIWTAENQLHTFAADLTLDFVDRFLVPLTRAVETGAQLLARDWLGEPNSPSALPRWASTTVVSDDLLPEEYEVRLEDSTMWPSDFERLLQSTTGESMADPAFRHALADIFTANSGWLEVQNTWTPPANVLITEGMGTAARFEVALRAGDIQAAAGEWLARPDGAFQEHIRQSLGTWLTAEPVHAEDRALQLQTGIRHLLDVAKPLVDLDEHTAVTLLGTNNIRSNVKRLMTPIPLEPTLPVAVEIAHSLQQDYGFDAAATAAAFDPASDPVSIDVITTLAGPVSPLVIRSLTAPIAAKLDATRTLDPDYDSPLYPEEWLGRRSRRLASSVPIPPHLWRALLRGWYVSSLLGQLDVTDPRRPQIWDGQAWATFGHLLPPFPRRGNEVLVSILEGLPYAFVKTPLTPQAWEPIRTLAARGGWTQNDTQQPVQLPAVDQWLTFGIAPYKSPGELDATLKGHEAPAARLTALTARVDALVAQYESVWESGPPQPFDRHAVGRFDLAPDVGLALAQIIAAAQQSPSVADEQSAKEPDV